MSTTHRFCVHQPAYISRWPTPKPKKAEPCEPELIGRQSKFLEDLEEAPWPARLLRPSEQELLALKARRRRPSLSSSLRSVKSFLSKMKFWRRKPVEDWGL